MVILRKTHIGGHIATAELNISPQNGVIIIEPLKEDSGGIYIPEEHDTNDFAGVVLAVGGPMTNEHGVTFETKVKVGDKIVHKNYGDHKYNHGIGSKEKKLKFIFFSDVLGIIE